MAPLLDVRDLVTRFYTSQGVVRAVNGVSFSLEAGETTPVTLLVPFSYSELGNAAASLLRDGRLRYRFAGSFTVGSPIGDIRIPFDQDGILDP